MLDNLKNDTKGLTDNVQAYIENRINYLKLDFFKKSMLGVTTLVKILLVGFLVLISFFFLSIAGAIWLGELLGSPIYGYLIVGGFYSVLVIGVLLFAIKPIERFLFKKYAKLFS